MENNLYNKIYELTKDPMWLVYSPSFYGVIMSDRAHTMFLQQAPEFELKNHEAFKIEQLSEYQTRLPFLTETDVVKTLKSNIMYFNGQKRLNFKSKGGDT